ncbi:DUF4149 domain-containing protein [Acidocella sp.]|uniref:DUF4149 domain-containing protein n=1 Tax=Acidocella sp. TaxID=50710 RepID=UPI00262C2530|nr:DUF4149 domain-containing protein [Acidocella sp.]
MRRLGGILSVTGLGLLAGGMLLFPLFTYLAFARLPLAVAGPFVKGCFPSYYGFMLVTSGLALIGCLLRHAPWATIVPGLTFAATIWAWFWLIPLLNAYQAAGNTAAFNRGHTISIWMDGIEFLAVLAVLIREGAGLG